MSSLRLCNKKVPSLHNVTGFSMSRSFVSLLAAEDNITVTTYRSTTDNATTELLSTTGEFLSKMILENEVMSINSSGPVVLAEYSQTC